MHIIFYIKRKNNQPTRTRTNRKPQTILPSTRQIQTIKIHTTIRQFNLYLTASAKSNRFKKIQIYRIFFYSLNIKTPMYL